MPRPVAMVAGGAGFLGRHFTARLLEAGWQVLVVDNYLTGRPQNLAALQQYYGPQLQCLTADITAPLPPSLQEATPALVANFACAASPPRYQANPVHTALTNVVGTQQLLALASAAKATFLQASTSEVYGDPKVHPQPEDYVGHVTPLGPRACYDEGKRLAETLCMDYHRQHGVTVKIARIFNTYGPYMDPADGRVVTNLLLQALQGQPLTLYGDGRQTRSLCYVDDLIEGLLRLALETPATVTGPVNLGNDEEIDLLTLADTVKTLVPTAGPVVFKPLPQDDPKQRCPDLSLAKRLLNYTPRTPWQEGLKHTLHHLRQEVEAATPTPDNRRQTVLFP